MKRRQRSKVRYSIDIEYPDGMKISQVLELSQTDSQAPDAEVIEGLSKLTQLSTSELKNILGSG